MPDRRQVLRTTAACALVACGGALAACGGGSGSTGGSKDVAPAGTKVGKAADVPVAGAAIFPDANVLVSQPTDGEFKAFSAICTHQGCVLGEVDGDAAVCPCHGSRFSITDGSVLGGPAPEPLPPEQVRLDGSTLVLG